MSKSNRNKPATTSDRKLVGMYFNFDEPFAKLIRESKRRKGLAQNEYLQALITVGDKLIPGMKIVVQKVPKP